MAAMERSSVRRRFVRTIAMIAGAVVLAAAPAASADGWHHHHGYYGHGYYGHGWGYGHGWYGPRWGIGPRWGWGGGPVYAPPVVAPAPYYGAPAYPYGYPGPYGGGYYRPGVQLYFGPHFGVGF
jgi:hypothetical protein